MAFIRKRRSSKTRFSYPLVETFREGPKVRHRTLLNLSSSPTLEAAIQERVVHVPTNALPSWCSFRPSIPKIS